MLSSTGDARRLLEKYRFEASDSHHTMYRLMYAGKMVLGSRVSHGNKAIPPRIVQEIRKQMKLSSAQFQHASGCTLNLEAYLAILPEKGLLPDSE